MSVLMNSKFCSIVYVMNNSERKKGDSKRCELHKYNHPTEKDKNTLKTR